MEQVRHLIKMKEEDKRTIKNKMLDIAIIVIMIITILMALRIALFYNDCQDCIREGVCDKHQVFIKNHYVGVPDIDSINISDLDYGEIP